ncbi:MAG: YggT family protein [Robiginitomaculum sp.]|nr:MAG: YggT family protein [Robiginitomaculum sp.]
MSYAIINLLLNIINLYLFVIIIWVIAGWLRAFGVIDARHPVVRQILSILSALVEPVLAPIRRVIPSIGGLDLSPLVLILGLYFILNFLQSFRLTGSLL